jgi:hypothetical protein
MNREKNLGENRNMIPSGKDIGLGTLSLCGYRPPEESQVHVSALTKDWPESVNHDSSSFRTMYASLYCGSERMENGEWRMGHVRS